MKYIVSIHINSPTFPWENLFSLMTHILWDVGSLNETKSYFQLSWFIWKPYMLDYIYRLYWLYDTSVYILRTYLFSSSNFISYIASYRILNKKEFNSEFLSIAFCIFPSSMLSLALNLLLYYILNVIVKMI